MTYIIDRNKFKTELGKKTYDRLKAIKDDNDFMLSILIDLIGDGRKLEFLQWLEKTGTTNPKEIENYIDQKYNSQYFQ